MIFFYKPKLKNLIFNSDKLLIIGFNDKMQKNKNIFLMILPVFDLKEDAVLNFLNGMLWMGIIKLFNCNYI